MAFNAKQKKSLASFGISIDKDGIKFDAKKLLGMDEKTLIEIATSTEESTIDIKPKPEGFNILDDDELKAFESRVKGEAKPEMEKATKEILSKIWKEKHGVKLDTKDPDEVLAAIVLAESTKAVNAAKLTVDEQVKLKDIDLDKLRNNFKELEAERDSFKSKAEQSAIALDEYKDTTDFGSLVSGKFTPLLKPAEIRARLKEEEGIEIKRVNGVWKPIDSEGNVIKNKLRIDSSVDEVIKGVLEKRKEWAAPVAGPSGGNAGGGNGTGNSGSGGNGDGGSGGGNGSAAINNMSAFKAHAKEQKWNVGRQQIEYNKVLSENKDFNPNE